MNRMRNKLIVAGTVLVVAIAYLALAGAKKGWVYYVQVDQFVNSPEYHNQRVKLCGTVSPDDLTISRGAMNARFVLLGATQHVPVVYHGVVPDLFEANHDVVVEGKLDSSGVFQADSLMTKCASKYQAEGHPTSQPSGGSAS
jgi:cytochrome c-type biogenesis protein CcmE